MHLYIYVHTQLRNSELTVTSKVTSHEKFTNKKSPFFVTKCKGIIDLYPLQSFNEGETKKKTRGKMIWRAISNK